jgi:hypothetical protein
MTNTQVEFLKNLASSKNVKCRFTFGYNYELTFENGTIFHSSYYDCLRKLGYFKFVN